MNKSAFTQEIKVGIFVFSGLAFLIMAIFLLGDIENIFRRSTPYTAYFQNADGLLSGAKVELNGLKVGIVDKVALTPNENKIKVDISIENQYTQWVRADSKTSLLTQGVLGDKYVSITAGTYENAELKSGSTIETLETKQLSEFFSDSGDVIESMKKIASSLERLLLTLEKDKRMERIFEGLAKTSQNLSEATASLNKEMSEIKIKESVSHLNSILKKIDGGQGTVGALINDTSLYDDAKSLISGINRNRIMRNLVRQTVRDGDSEDKTPLK